MDEAGYGAEAGSCALAGRRVSAPSSSAANGAVAAVRQGVRRRHQDAVAVEGDSAALDHVRPRPGGRRGLLLIIDYYY